MLKLNAVDTAPLVSSDTLAPLPPLRAQQIAFEQALPAHRPPAPRPPFDKGDETTEAAATADAPTSTPLADQPAAPAAGRGVHARPGAGQRFGASGRRTAAGAGVLPPANRRSDA